MNVERRPKTKPDNLNCESACTSCQKLHPPSPFIIITQPESWYSFYRPTEGKRLSRPSWPVTYRDGLPVHRRSPILVLTGSDVAQGQRVTTKPNRQPETNIPFRFYSVTLMSANSNLSHTFQRASQKLTCTLCYWNRFSVGLSWRARAVS